MEIKQVKMDNDFNDLFCGIDMDVLEWVFSKVCRYPEEELHGKIKVLNSKLPRLNEDDKRKNVDLLLEYNDEILLIELNNNFIGRCVRNLLYAFNIIYSRYFKSNEPSNSDYYKIVHKLTLVNLNWYNKKRKNAALKAKPIRDVRIYGNTSKKILLQIKDINLDYFEKLSYNDVTNGEEKFYKLLTVKDKHELDNLTKNEKLLVNYAKRITKMSEGGNSVIWNKELDEYFRKSEDYEIGMLDGTDQKEKEIVLNMNENNFSFKDIVKATKLSIDDVKKIINEKNRAFAK